MNESLLDVTRRLEELDKKEVIEDVIELRSWLEADGVFEENANDLCKLVASASGDQSVNSMGYYTATMLGARLLSSLRVKLYNKEKDEKIPLGLMMGLIATSGSGKDYTINIADDIYNQVMLDQLIKNIRLPWVDKMHSLLASKEASVKALAGEAGTLKLAA